MRQGTFTPNTRRTDTELNLVFFCQFFHLPRGVMDKAVECGTEGPRFDPCHRQLFFFFLFFFRYFDQKKIKKKKFWIFFNFFFSIFFWSKYLKKRKKKSCLWQGSNRGPSAPHSTALSITPRGKLKKLSKKYKI